MVQSIVRRKLLELFQKHSAGGTTPRRILESNMARELRFSKENIHQMLEEMHVLTEEMKSKRMRRVNGQPFAKSAEAYQKELNSFR